MRNWTRRVLSATAAVSATAVLATPALAIPPADFDPGRDRPPSGEAVPPTPMKQTTLCATSAVLPDSQFDTIPASHVFRVDDLHAHATGVGQTVAVIDSGVTPNARLPLLRGGGDYIMGGDGLEDCDHHGTLIAGIIAAAPARNDGFIGVAPSATILSIRQTSGAFAPVDHEASAQSLYTLASAIRRAADEGATVINLSVTACVPSNSAADLSELKGALHYAAVEKDVVVIASAGNVDDACPPNPGPTPDDPEDDRGWGGVETISLPSYIDQFVLSVGGTTLTGDPYINTLPGPWVDVAAPAINIVSLDPVDGGNGGLINAEITQNGTAPLSGTSFAAAYVSGLAALIREHHPNLNAEQVRNRIVNSAHPVADGSNNVFGRGIVDPMVALTGDVSAGEYDTSLASSQQAGEPRDRPEPRRIALYVSVSIAAVALIAAGAIAVRTYLRGPEKKDGKQ